jgi:epoxyqueuosine reductase
VLSAETARSKAIELGFNLVGITPAAPSPRLDAYFRWIELNMHGSMGYMAREDRQARRRDLNVILPGVQSIMIVGLDYHALNVLGEILADPARGRIASYAWGIDYHAVMTPRLEQLAAWMRDVGNSQLVHRVYVDTGAILERSHAQQAGMGFVGKNTMLIHPRRGSYFFLGEILIDAAFDVYDQPHRETICGSCVRCQVDCPTNAFPRPYVLDARRCISYLTIEHKGWIARDLRPLMGNWVFGCDVCQDVCPFNRFALPTGEPSFSPTDVDRAAPPLIDLLRLDAKDFRERFGGSPIARIGRDRLVRNACIAAGNWQNEAAIPNLIDLLRDLNPLVRGHAAWALTQIGGESALAAVHQALAREENPEARDDMVLSVSALPAP